MARFKFRLQSVIKVKEIQEKKIQREIAQVKRRILQEQENLENLEDERERVLSSSQLSGKMKAADIVVHQDYIKKISEQIRFENNKIENLNDFESKKIDEVLGVKKDREAIEHLREKRLEECKRDLERKEQVLIDAIAQRMNA
jgi:flagellar FliJ protein